MSEDKNTEVEQDAIEPEAIEGADELAAVESAGTDIDLAAGDEEDEASRLPVSTCASRTFSRARSSTAPRRSPRPPSPPPRRPRSSPRSSGRNVRGRRHGADELLYHV